MRWHVRNSVPLAERNSTLPRLKVFGQLFQVTFDGEYMRIFLPHCAQRLRQCQQIIGIGTAGTSGGGDLAGNLLFRGRAEEGAVFFRGNID